jgi:hypothetical protein
MTDATEMTHRLQVHPRLDARDSWQAVMTNLRTGHVTNFEVSSLSDITALMQGKRCEAAITHVVMRQMKSAGVWNLSDTEMAGQDIDVNNLR